MPLQADTNRNVIGAHRLFGLKQAIQVDRTGRLAFAINRLGKELQRS